jgi:hypothetical protein
MQFYGKPTFAMLPARCGPASTAANYINSAMRPGRSIWLLTPTAMVAVPRPPSASCELCTNENSTPTWPRYPKGTIPTASSRKAATRASSTRSWRQPYDEVSCRSPAQHQSSLQPFSHHRALPSAVRSIGSIGIWIHLDLECLIRVRSGVGHDLDGMEFGLLFQHDGGLNRRLVVSYVMDNKAP